MPVRLQITTAPQNVMSRESRRGLKSQRLSAWNEMVEHAVMSLD